MGRPPLRAMTARWAGPLTLDAAIRMALLQNPEIIAARQDHGIAAAAVMVAPAYPFNPVWESRSRYAFGSEIAGIFNHEPVENTVPSGSGNSRPRQIPQGRGHRRPVCTDWETWPTRRRPWPFAWSGPSTASFTAIKRSNSCPTPSHWTRDLRTWRRTSSGRANCIRWTLSFCAARSTTLAPCSAWRGRPWRSAGVNSAPALGVVGGPPFDLQGDLNPPPLPTEPAPVLGQVGRERRADRHAREAAVAEADARLRLERANRFGNPTVGPTYEYDNAAANNLGVIATLPLPVLNAHRGDILQREAEKTRAVFDLHATDVLIDQEVEAALARLQQARAWADTYENDVLPNLEKSLKEVRRICSRAATPRWTPCASSTCSVKCLTARDGLLDAQFEVRQAVADLAAALGDPSVAVGPCPPPGRHKISRCATARPEPAPRRRPMTMPPFQRRIPLLLTAVALAGRLRQAAGHPGRDAELPGELVAGRQRQLGGVDGTRRRDAAAARKLRPHHRPHRRPDRLPAAKGRTVVARCTKATKSLRARRSPTSTTAFPASTATSPSRP